MDYLKLIDREKLEDIVRELNIRKQIPKFTKVRKQELVEKLNELVDVVEKDGEKHIVLKNGPAKYV